MIDDHFGGLPGRHLRRIDEDLDEIAVGSMRRAISRSTRNALKAVSTISPASIISFALADAADIFRRRAAQHRRRI
jgi:hypothetical protein